MMSGAKWLSVAVLFAISALAPSGAAPSSDRRAVRPAIAPDIKPAALWDGRKEVEFHASTLPKMVKAADARFLIDNEYVLGISSNGESRAYPTRFASWHHIINDRIGKPDKGGTTFVTVTYCIVCNSGIRFDTPLTNHKPLQFDFYGLYNGVMTMYDKQTESVWLQVEGRAVKGPMLGATLKPGPLLDTTWGEWKRLHPDTLVMAPDPRFTDCYEPKGAVMLRGYSEFPADYFKKTVTHRDARLGMFESVIAVSMPTTDASTEFAEAAPEHHAMEPSDRPVDSTQTDGSPRYLHRAYPIKAFKGKTGVVNDIMGASPIAVLFLAGTETLNVVSRVVDGRTLTLEARKGPNGRFAFYDRETGTRWNVEGRAEAGPLTGKELPRVDSHMSQWYGWVSYFPETTVYGQDDLKQRISLK
jgi:hypothetical protein